MVVTKYLLNNDRGHVKSNVIASCIRCNYARGNMPHAAWLFLVDGMRKARESGAFGNWIGRFTAMNNRPQSGNGAAPAS